MFFPQVRLARRLAGWMIALATVTVSACQNEIVGDPVAGPAGIETSSAGSGVLGLAATTSPPVSGPAPAANADDGPAGSVASVDSDRQIAAVDLELDSRAIVMGSVADARAGRGDLRLFAIRMMTDDVAASRRVAAIVQGGDLSPEDSALRRQLGSETGQVSNSLWAEPRASFDRFYVDTQVAMHAAAVQMLTSLMARSQDAVLQAELRDQIDAWQKQLDDARALQASIAGGDNGATGPDSQAPASGAPP